MPNPHGAAWIPARLGPAGFWVGWSRADATPGSSQARSAHRLEFVGFSGASTFAKDIVQCVGKLEHGQVRDLRTGEVHGEEGQMIRTCVNAPEGHVEIAL